MKAGREAERWKDITADMMSDEEKRGDVYVRHRPDYRSDRFNTFIDKLDERSERKSKSHARFKRQVGTPLKTPRPRHIKSWMAKEEVVDNNSEQQQASQDRSASTSVVNTSDSIS